MTTPYRMFGSRKIATISLFINIIISLVTFVYGNGYLKEPISRNYFAYKYGVGDGSTDVEGLPPKEICHYCLNTNAGVCGIASYTTDYDDPRDTLGQPLPWDSTATYAEGDIITIKFDVTTFRSGHVTMSACPLDGDGNATMACLARHSLDFIEDVSYEMPPDGNYPDRGYLRTDKEEYEMRFRLPEGLVGEEVLLQWRYVTGDVTCHAVGYEFYHWPEGSYYHDELDDCAEELNDDGMVDETSPEQFFNCAEVTILPKVSTEVEMSSSSSSDDDGGDDGSITVVHGVVDGGSEYCCTKDNITCVAYCDYGEEACRLCSDDVYWMPIVGSSSNASIVDSNSSRFTEFTPVVTEPVITPDYRNYKTIPAPSSINSSNSREGSEYCCTKDNITCVPYCDFGEEACLLCSDDVFWMPIREVEVTNNSSSDDGNSSVDEFTTTPTTTPNDSPTTSPPPSATLSCSQGRGFSSWEALIEIDQITHEVSTNPYELSVVTDDDIVLSEMQAYAMLLSSLALVSLHHNDNASENDFLFATKRFEGYFNGWRRMCRYSRMNNCQNVTYCDNGRFLGTTPCLPAWKHSIDLTHVLGHESAANADEDGIVAMIIALRVVESRDTLPSWYEEVRDWADRSCTQFLLHDTVASPRRTSSTVARQRRLLKLGECWGGWDEEGNTPSYHAPGHYRLMRDFQMSMTDVRTYELPTDIITTPSSLSRVWDSLIETSYEFLKSVQCPETGLVTNWALVTEEQQNKHKNKTMALVARHPSGSFVSGSGSDPNEFGTEASKTMWRIAFDAALYPDEAQRTAAAATSFLSPLHNRLVSHFEYTVVDDEPLGDFGDESLKPCASSSDNFYGDGNNDKQHLVTSVPSAWMWISHIASPVLSTLGTPINPELFSDKAFDQQFMVDTACDYTQDLDDLGDDHYSLSWQLLAMVILNGDVTKAGQLLATTTPTHGETHPSHAPSLLSSSSSIPSPNNNNKTNNQQYCCSIDDIPCSEFSDVVCHESRYDCVDMCGGQWVVSSVVEDDVSSSSSSSSGDGVAAPSEASRSRIR